MNLDAILDTKLSRRARNWFLVIVCILPALYVLKQYNPRTRFTSLIYFGPKFLPQALPEIRALHPAVTKAPDGYDGQFYAQIAVKPLLNDPRLASALDSASYRSRKILLPALAWMLGWGNPAWVVNIYAMLNLVFWYLLCLGMVHYLRAETWRDFLCILATVYTTGALFSLQRSLTDLPAMTLGFYAAAWTGVLASCSIGLGLLTRDTSVVFLLRDAWPFPRSRSAIASLALKIALIVTPAFLWRLYVRHVFGEVSLHSLNIFGPPLLGAWEYLCVSWHDLCSHPFKYTLVNLRLYSVLGAISLAVQVCCMVVWRKIECPYWRIGAGLALLMVFFTAHMYDEYTAVCRYSLSLTLAFNIGLMQRRGYPFVFCFIMGNIGLLWGFFDILLGSLLRFR
jgi:hypothetical protein